MSLTDTHRMLGVGEVVQYGDVYKDGDPVSVKIVGYIVNENDGIQFYRPLIRETAPHIFDERNAPELAVLKEANGDILSSDTNGDRAKTHDDGKPPLAQVPWAAIREMASVQLYGQKKYGDFYNYRKGLEVSRNLSCAIRHIAAYMDGENLDPESQCSHLGHAMCRLAFVLQNMKDGTLIDDRYNGGAK